MLEQQMSTMMTSLYNTTMTQFVYGELLKFYDDPTKTNNEFLSMFKRVALSVKQQFKDAANAKKDLKTALEIDRICDDVIGKIIQEGEASMEKWKEKR